MSRNDVSASLPPDPSLLSSPPTDTTPGDGLAAWILKGPLAVTLGLLVVLQVATWLPHYLTWPFWCDHDVHATLARGWDRGLLPYRDLRCNNFPGSIYLFWMVGKIGGWGRTLPFYALDAGLLLGLGAALLTWSRRQLGGIVPGLVGYLAFLSYYMGLDYSHAGQKDWHGPCFAVLGLLAAQTWSGRTGRFLSALAFAAAITIRPQVILLFPAIALALDESRRRAGEPLWKTLLALLEWGIALALFVAVAFLPLVFAGIFPDFVRGIRLVSYGGRYNQVTVSSAVSTWLFQMTPLRLTIIPLALLLLARLGDRPMRRTALIWGTALLGVTLYRPLSPFPHSYLTIPLMLIWSVNLGVLAYLVLKTPRPAPSFQLVAVLMILSLGTTIRPAGCLVGQTRRAIATLRNGGEMPQDPPFGYRPGAVPAAAYYTWSDYRGVVEYLRRETDPDTRVANVLKGDPAITAPSDRPPAFPAESVTWVRMVNPDDEAPFAEALVRGRNTVVVWSPDDPGPRPPFITTKIDRAIREYYQPEARFGVIEIWRRKGEARTGNQGTASRLGPKGSTRGTSG